MVADGRGVEECSTHLGDRVLGYEGYEVEVRSAVGFGRVSGLWRVDGSFSAGFKKVFFMDRLMASLRRRCEEGVAWIEE